MLYREPVSGKERPAFVSVADAAKILGFEPFAVLQLADSGEIRATEHDGRSLLLLDSVDQYVEQMKDEA